MTKERSKFPQIDTVILDMDGVITSERRYWEAGGLTVAEILESEVYLGLNPTLFQADAPLEQLLNKVSGNSCRMRQSWLSRTAPSTRIGISLIS